MRCQGRKMDVEVDRVGKGRERGRKGGEGGAWVGKGLGGKVEGSEAGGAWVGTGLGREDGGERDGRRMGGDGGGEGRWRGARREVHEWGRGLGREDGGSETGWVGTGLREDGGERDGGGSCVAGLI